MNAEASPWRRGARRGSLLPAVSRPAGACALVVLAGALAAEPAVATLPGSSGRVAFSNGYGVFVKDPSKPDAAAVNLMPDERRAGYPRWSPDGTQLAFLRGSQGIVIANADGSGRRAITSPAQGEYDLGLAWSPDGKRLVFYRMIPQEDGPAVHQLRIVDVASGGDGAVIAEPQGWIGGKVEIEWSPDGSQIAVEARGAPNDHLYLMTPTGSMRLLRNDPAPFYPDGRRLSWSPDGKRLAYAPPEQTTVRFFTRAGADDGSLTLAGAERIGGIMYAPDGAHLFVQRCPSGPGRCKMYLRQLPDPERELEFDPEEPEEQELAGLEFDDGPVSTFDVQPQRQPIIFIHGFAGSRIGCGGDEMWPPTLGNNSEDLLNMRLSDDGVSNLPSDCGPAATGILDTAYGFADVYQSTLNFLGEIAPDDHHVFVWDWRKDPRLQIIALNTLINDALGAPLQKAQGVDRVVLYGHSMGGLVMRAYLDDPELAKKVSRAVTAGTPYLGAPKAIFPLASGTEMPGGTGDLDKLLPDGAFRSFARNLSGLYFLYPSEAYGPWLTIQGRTPTPLDRPGLLESVAWLGGNRSLLARALDAHRDELDGFKRNGVDLRVFVGTGLSTVGAVTLIPGSDRQPNAAHIRWTTGDGTVPFRSAQQGSPLPTSDPLGDNVPLSYVCRVGHVSLPGAPSVTTPIRDFLLRGTPPERTRDLCVVEATEVRFNNITLGDPDLSPVRVTQQPSASARAGAQEPTATPAAPMRIEDASVRSKLQLLELPGETVAMVEKHAPVDVTVQADGARLAVTNVIDEKRAAPVYFGPVTGELRLKTGSDGAVQIFDDGAPVQPRATAQPGDPDADPGPVDSGGGEPAPPEPKPVDQGDAPAGGGPAPAEPSGGPQPAATSGNGSPPAGTGATGLAPGAAAALHPFAPRFTRPLTMLRKRFAVAYRPAPSARKRRTAPAGSAFVYSLSKPATVTITIASAKPGRTVGRRCQPSTRLNRARRRCTRHIRIGTLRHRGSQAANRVSFNGRIGGRKLSPGRYRATAVARDPAGNASAPTTTSFTIVAR